MVLQVKEKTQRTRSIFIFNPGITDLLTFISFELVRFIFPNTMTMHTAFALSTAVILTTFGARKDIKIPDSNRFARRYEQAIPPRKTVPSPLHRAKEKPVFPSRTPNATAVITHFPKPTSTAVPLQPSRQPTWVPTPAQTVPTIPPPQPTSAAGNNNSGDTVVSSMMAAINKYRAAQNLAPVKTDSYSCSFAIIRAQEISKSFSHDGFQNRINNNTLPYPGYSVVTENIAKNSNYQDVVNQWINSPGHAENMRRDTPFVCVGREGDYYAYEGWKPK